jgi:hypothetical protein
MPTNVCINVDQDEAGEETTRRIGGISVMPSFQPMTMGFQPQSMSPSFMGASFSTAPQKAAPRIVAPMLSMALPATKIGWKLHDAPSLPEFHPLERTAVFVAKISAGEVAKRVSEVLRDRSIEATYDNMKAKAKCRTADHVDFRVRLYRGRNQYSHGIIVEVQRRFGSSSTFHEDTTAILDAAQGKVPPPPSAVGGLPLVSDSEDDYNDSSLSSLAFVAKMLAFPGYDSHNLALQTLASLSDASKMGFKTARKVSKALVETDSEVGSKVVSLVVDNKLDEEETFGLRVQAMAILANAIPAVHGNIAVELRERLRPVFIKQLKKAESNPQLAYLASKCVEPLIDGDHNRSEIHSALEVARSVGEARHAALCRQAEQCIQKISSL